jgi:lysophospholipase
MAWNSGHFAGQGGLDDPSRADGQLWNLQSNLILPDDGKLSFYYDMVSNVRAKSNAGFQTQIVRPPYIIIYEGRSLPA